MQIEESKQQQMNFSRVQVLRKTEEKPLSHFKNKQMT